MTDHQLVMKRANKFYQSGAELDRENLILIYEDMSDAEKERADKEIRKLLPSWNS